MQSFRKSLTNKTTSLKNSLLPDENNSFKQSMSKPVTSVMERMSSARDSLKSFSKSGTEVVGSVAQTTSGFFNMKNILFAIIIIFFLAFLGFNIFKYFASGTDRVSNLLSPIIAVFGSLTGDTAKTTINETSGGSKIILDKALNTGQTLLDNVQQGATSGITSLQDGLNKTASQSSNNGDDLTLSIVNTANADKMGDSLKKGKNNDYEPEPTQTNTLNQGYCYIGKINDTRYCAKVSSREHCMSGDIYPSMDICINPSLRV
tara:strand:+ start:5203 stop:5985 length:783 start_codon:yes stop_codon:yes gene_type:complete